jgi:hypothetical protein
MPRFDKYRARAAISFLLQKAGGTCSYYSVIKLMYLAEKKQLRKSGRTITGDLFYRLPHGGTGTGTLDMLKAARGDENQSEQLKDFVKSHFIVDGKRPNYKARLLKDPELEELSPSEQKTLREIYSEFGQLKFAQLRQAAHDHAYKLKPAKSKSEITYEHLADQDPDLKEHLRFVCNPAPKPCDL